MFVCVLGGREPQTHARMQTRTCTMLGWLRLDEIAASMTAIFSRFSAPLMLAGRIIVLIATTVPRHRPLYTCTKRVGFKGLRV